MQPTYKDVGLEKDVAHLFCIVGYPHAATVAPHAIISLGMCWNAAQEGRSILGHLKQGCGARQRESQPV